jgi:hypothetical protein
MKSTLLIAAAVCATSVLVQCAPAPSLPEAGATRSGTRPSAGNPPPLRALAPVPLSQHEKKINEEVDAEICAAYRRWRAQGNSRTAHMEEWCPTGRP